MPNATPKWIAHVIERGLAHVAECGLEAVDLEADRADNVTRDLLLGRGFRVTGAAVVECRLDAAARPDVSPLHDGYRLAARSDTMQHPRHMSSPRRPGYEQRLQQTSIYRSDLDLDLDLDLVVFDSDDQPATS